jgi:23S rRNA (adenine2030-N6)-methyltransferase
MNYRHIYHAGNFADAFKHIILMLLTKSFLKKETPFCFLDTHAGIGHYDLMSVEAQKGKEYENGIKKIIEADDPPEAIREYIACIQNFNAKIADNECRLYPGSPEIVKAFLRPHDRMQLCELHPEDYKTLKKYFARHKQIAVHHQDAYQSFKALLPPKEKRGLILIDPPYENTNELSHLVTMLPQALSRFETGVYALWYPIRQATYRKILP